VTQSDTFDSREQTALEQVMERLEGSQSIGFVRMSPQDIQRHPRIEQILSRL
jgi:phosphate starvation-inducible protein PhoH